jgi:putative hemolysin
VDYIAIWLVAIATVLSGFFSLNGFALRSLSRARIDDAFGASNGRRRQETLEENLHPLQLTIAMCRVLANLLLVAGMIRLLALGESRIDWPGIFVAIASAGGIIAIFGIAIPHAWASCSGEKILAATLPALMLLRYLLYPVTAVMQAFDLPIRRLAGAGEISEETEEEDAKQEILHAAAEGAAEGLVDEEEVEMIESVMEFGDIDAAQIMTPRTDIFALSDETTWLDAAREIHEAGHTRVPVYHDNLDNITGVIYAKDILKYVGVSEPVELKAITRKPFFVPETKPLDDLLREFKSRKVHLAVVLDEYGGTAGLVSIEDVIEEIVGNISDEYDQAEDEQIRRINETTAEVDGRLRVDEFNDLMGTTLPEDEDYDTVAGFAIAKLGYIPAGGESLIADGVKIHILAADERRITKLRIAKLDEQRADE